MKLLTWSVFVAVFAGNMAAQIIDVPAVKYDRTQRTTFSTRERIVLYADVRRGDLYQARLLRGTKESWIRAIPALTTAGCVEFRSAPFVVSVDTGLIDLEYLRFTPQWVRNEDGDIEDTPYVVVLERIKRPDLRRNLRLKPGFARTYIERALQITLTAPAPTKPPLIARFFGALFGAIGGATASAAPVQPTTARPPASTPPAERPMDCLDFRKE
ncbi:MAG TPA: hypothetical protein VE974_18545 [Thermoanaerobaculia bacterium]|nr:hypothetical protein [Thermoanaerobaculia bacterium]